MKKWTRIELIQALTDLRNRAPNSDEWQAAEFCIKLVATKYEEIGPHTIIEQPK